MIPLEHKIICIVGPTASGKSDLAQEIALALGGEIVSADSMQIYRGMDIGTGKVTSDQQRVRPCIKNTRDRFFPTSPTKEKGLFSLGARVFTYALQ